MNRYRLDLERAGGIVQTSRRNALLALLALLVFAGVMTATPTMAATSSSTIIATRVEGPITPVIADHLVDGVRASERDGHLAYLVELDTPGGLDTSMREIIQAFLGSRVPVVVHVSPSGSRAASAGALITFAAHIAAMAPGTTIGAATPVDLQGGNISDKVINDAAAFAESVAAQRDRNTEFAVATVREGRAVPAEEAKQLGAIDLIAPDQSQLLTALDGRTVRIDDRTVVTLRTADAQLVHADMGRFRQLLQLLADPNLAFLFLSLGTLAIIYELAGPGAGLSGILGMIMLILGFFALSVLPVNIAGIALVALAAALFAAELFTPGVGVFAAGGSIALLLGGIFLFEGSVGVSPAVLLPLVAIVGGGSLLAGRLAWKARQARPTTGYDALVGHTTVVRTVDDDIARVQLEGGWWTARNPAGPLQVGQTVRVVAVEGLELIVEPSTETENQS